MAERMTVRAQGAKVTHAAHPITRFPGMWVLDCDGRAIRPAVLLPGSEPTCKRCRAHLGRARRRTTTPSRKTRHRLGPQIRL